MSIKAIVMDTKDNVATLLTDVEADTIVFVTSARGDVLKKVEAAHSIPFGHKMAIVRIERNQLVFKYGEIIGEATEPIKEGEHVHVHNVKSLRVRATKK